MGLVIPRRRTINLGLVWARAPTAAKRKGASRNVRRRILRFPPRYGPYRATQRARCLRRSRSGFGHVCSCNCIIAAQCIRRSWLARTNPPLLLRASPIIATVGCGERENSRRFQCQTGKASHSRGAGGARALRRRDPLKVRGRREDRAPAGTHGPRAIKKHAAEPQAQPRIPGLPCAVVLTAYSELSPGTGLSCPRHPQSARCTTCGLSASVGAPGPHGLAVREAIVRPHSKECCDLSRPPLPASTSVTIAKRPSARGGMRRRCG